MTTRLTAQQIREKLINYKRRMRKLEVSLPDLEELDDHLAILEFTAKDVEDTQELSKGENGKVSDLLALGTLVARSLVLHDTKERIFQDNDAQFLVDNLGITVLMPLGEAVKDFNGIGSNALDKAKKNLPMTPDGDSATSSEEK